MTAIKWKSGATGDWNMAGNWSPGAVPGANDAVTIAAAGSYDVVVDDAESAQSILLNSANATLTVEGAPNVVLSLGGNLNTVSGTLSLVADDTDGSSSITGGTVTVGANGTLFTQPFQNGARGQDFNVNAVANLAGKTSIAAGADLVFLEGGTIGGTCAGAGDLSLNSPNFSSTMSTYTSTVAALSSLGNWDVGGATLILPNGASGNFGGNVAATSSGTIVLLGNNTISVAGGLSVNYSGNLAIGPGSRITLPGQILLNNFGQIYVAPGATMSVSGSLQVGLGSVFLDNTYNSEIYGGGTLATQGATTIAYANDADQLLLGENQTWSNTGSCEVYAHIAMNLVSQDTVTIVNQKGGLIDLSTDDASIIDHLTDGTDTLTNAGTLARGLDPGVGSANGTSSIAAAVTSTGLIDVVTGALAFSDGGTLGGTLSGNGTLLLYAGTFAIGNMAGGGILSVGSGAVATYAASPTLHAIYVLGGGESVSLTASQTLTLAGGLIAGDTNGAGTIAGGTLVASDFATVIDGGATPELVLAGNLVFDNTGNFTAQGLMEFDAPSGSFSPTVSILNAGIFNFADDDASLLSDGTGGAAALTNTGTLTKTAGTGTSTLLGRVASTGLMSVASGTLALFGGGALGGSEAGAGVLGLAAGTFTTAGLAGTGTLSVTGNTSLSETSATGTITTSILLGNGGAIVEAAGKTATLSGPLTVSSGAMGGGALGGPGTITTTGTTTVPSNPGTVQMTVYGGVTLNTTGKFNDAGEIAFNQYDSGTSDGATIVNTGTFILTDDDAGLAPGAGSTANAQDVFRNTGTLTKSGGTGTSTIAVSVASTGPIAVNTGTLTITAGGSVSGSLSGAGTLLLSGGTYTIGTINGPNGHLAFGPGVVLAGSPVINAAFTLDGGNTLTIAAGHTLTEGGPFTIGDGTGGGTITGPGTLATTGVTSIYDGGTNILELALDGGLIWKNSGTVSDGGFVYGGYPGSAGGALITNTGTFNFTSDDGSLTVYDTSSANTFTNTGTLAKTGGTATSTLGFAVADTGVISVASGTLALTGGGTVGGTLSGGGLLNLQSGSFTTGGIAGAGHLAVTGASTVLAGTASGTITASVQVSSNATLSAAPKATTLKLAGAVTLGDASGYGAFSGPGTISTAGVTTIIDGGTSILDMVVDGGVTWANSGTVNDGGFGYGAYPGSAGGAAVVNSGTFNFTSDDASLTVYDTSSANTFTNTGTLAKTGGTATSTLGFAVADTGVISVASGTLALTGGGTVGGTLSGGGLLNLQSGSFTTGGIAGAGHLAVTGASTVLAGTASGTITASVQVSSNATLSAAPKATTLKLAGAVTLGDASGYGAFSGPGTISTAGVTTIIDGGTSILDMVVDGGVTWANSGTVNDAGFGYAAYPGSSGGAAIVNSGNFNFTSDDGSLTVYDTSTANTFTNTGTLAKTGGIATSTLGLAVNSTGVVSVASGTLALTGGGAVSGSLSGGGVLDLATGTFTSAGLSGTGHLAVTSSSTRLTETASGTIASAALVSGSATLAVSPKSATLVLSGPVTLGDATGAAILSGPGTIATTGTTTVLDSGNTILDVAISGGLTWANSGTVLDGGFGYAAYPGSSGGATISNSGTFDFTSDDATLTVYDTSTANTFTNTGTLAKTGGIGTSQIGLVVNSTGALAVASGTLALGAGGVVSGTLAGAGDLALAGGTFTTSGLSGAGTLLVNSALGGGGGIGAATLVATTNVTVSDTVIVGGESTIAPAAGKTLTFTGPVTLGVAGDYARLNGAGTIVTTNTVLLPDAGTNIVDVDIGGGITWTNSGAVGLGGLAYLSLSSTINNLTGGALDFTTDDASIQVNGAAGGTGQINNSGTLAKTGGTATSTIGAGITVNSTGTIAVASGTLALSGGGALSGALSGGGQLDLAAGTFTTTGLTGVGNLAITGGNTTLTQTASGTIATALLASGNATLAVSPAAAVLTLPGQVTLGDASGYGAFTGPGTLATTGTTTIFDGGTNVLELGLGGGLIWANSGTVDDAGLLANGTGGSTIVNSGTFDLTTDDAGMADYTASGTFTNTGLLAKIGGTGTSTISVAISNTGTIEAAHGTLALAGGVAGNGNLKIDAGATLDVSGTLPASQKIAFTGGAGATLKLETPASIGTLTNFTAGDRLDLVGTTVTSTKVSGNTLSVVTSAGTYTYVSAGIAGEVATTAGDGNGGTFVSLYRAAIATHTPEPLAFGNFHVGSTTGTTAALTVTNVAPADGYSEKLNAGFGGASAGFTAAGTVTGLAAGASNSTSLTATINTGTAGAKSGTATLTLASNGAGIDGRGTTALPSQTVNLTGGVYNLAVGTLTSASVALGNQHVGAGASSFITITNTAPAGAFSEGLDASFTKSTGAGTGAGSLSVLAAGASNSTSLSVGLAPATAGAATGTETVTFVSDGAGTSGLGTTTLGTQTVSITGTYYNLAAATLGATTIAFGNHHVGDTVAARTLKLTNSAPAGAFSEALDAGFASATAGVTTAGTITGLAAGSSNSTSLTIGETAAVAGTLSGAAVLNLVSDGTGIDGLGTTTLTGQTITVTGANYNLAVGQLGASTVSLGVIHAATAASGAVTLTNAAPTGGYSESLDAGLTGASAGLSTSGSITGLAASLTDTSTLQVSVKTAATGAYSGTATLGLISDGAGTSGLGTTTLTSQIVTVTATVDNYAVAAFEDPSGPAITGTSTNGTINLGSAIQGAAAATLTLGVLNAATGLADLLGGTLTSAGGAGFTNSGFGTFSGLSAGQDEHAQGVSLSTSAAGTFTETVVLSSYGTNASGYNGALAPETLTILGTVTASTFHTYTLGLGPNVIQGADGLGDVFIARAGSLNSRDQLTGGSGANSVTLAGAGLFDINAPKVFANIPTINATEGQAAMGSAPDTTQTVLLRDGANETLNVAAGTAGAGNTNAEAITIYGGTGADTINLAGGADQVFLGTGAETVTLGGAANAVTGGGGAALVHGTAAFASAAVVGTSGAATTLEVTTGGNITLNAADTYLAVQLDAASTLNLSAMSFITALGSSGADTITAMAGTQTLTGGAGLDTLVGYSGGNDIFADTGAGLNGDTIKGWTTGDVIDVKDFANATLKFASNTLTITNGGTSTAIKFSAGLALHNFTVIGSDGGAGVLIGFHT